MLTRTWLCLLPPRMLSKRGVEWESEIIREKLVTVY